MAATLISSHTLDDPANPPNAAEAAVAEALLKLGTGFVVRWGFEYSDETGAVQSEGDFLVLGPDGNVLHLEVKSGPVTFDPKKRRFQTADGRNPLTQRDQVWEQVVRALKKQGRMLGLKEPLVQRMLALPDVMIAPEATVYETMPREGILDTEDLKNIAQRWQEMFTRKFSDAEDRRKVFLARFAQGLGSGVTRHTLDFADRIIERHTAASFWLLDAIDQNDQLLFCGGPGTGKTWLAIEMAHRWGAKGQRVLFLTYNLKLAEMLQVVIARLGLAGVMVHSYEGLAEWIYQQCGETWNAPDHGDREACAQFFDIEMPGKLLEVAGLFSDAQKFDALVVDEAQDHNTAFDPAVGADPKAVGWWEIYTRLLKEGAHGRVAAFYDARQRHFARGNLFEADRLNALFPTLMHIRLRRTLRYTRQLRDFFFGIELPEVQDLFRDMAKDAELPEGPEPEIVSAKNRGEEKSMVGRILAGWCKGGPLHPEEVLILYPTTGARPDWLDN